MNYFYYALVAVTSYLIGSFSPAVYLSKKYAGYDIRQKGSKNAGSTNVFRVMGAKWGAINFLLDFSKGALPALAGFLIFGQTGAIIAGAGVILGHAFPVFSNFKGGKCVASSTGICLVLNPYMTLGALLVALLIVLKTKYVSLASITVFTIYPIITAFMNYTAIYKIFMGALGALILFLHRHNIVRLLKHAENPLFKSKS